MPENAAMQTWVPLGLTMSEQDIIRARVQDIAHRMRDPIYVRNVSQLAAYQSKYHLWIPDHHLYSLSHGPLGLALMYGELDRVFPQDRWDRVAHTYLELLQQAPIVEDYLEPGLFSGACGMLFVVDALSRQGTRYKEMRRNLTHTLLPSIFQFISKLPYDGSPRPERYNLATGVVGIGLALLARSQLIPEPEYASPPHEALMILRHLVWVGQQLLANNAQQFAAWYNSTALEQTRDCWKNMYTSWGVRSGLAGHIGLLSIAMKENLHEAIPDLADTLHALSHHLLQQYSKGNTTTNLLQRQSHQLLGDVYHHAGAVNTFAWCDGLSGIASILWLAGSVLQDSILCTFALERIDDAIQSCQQLLPAVGPSLCHGLAGLIQVGLRILKSTGDAALAERLRGLVYHLLEMFEPDRPFGYRGVEPEYIRTDFPWLLDGAAGVVLTLVATISREQPSWDRIMLLA